MHKIAVLGIGFLALPLFAQQEMPWPTDRYNERCGLQEEACGCLAGKAPCSRGFSIGFEALWWNAQNPGLIFGYNAVDDLEGNVLRTHAQWDPGIRVSLGWNSDYDRWDVQFIWTWYLNHSKVFGVRNDLGASPPGDLGYWSSWPPNTSSHYRSVGAEWHLLYNCFDLELGRSFYITRALSLRPHWGIRGASLYQEFGSSFLYSIPTIGQPSQTMHGSCDWWGVGPCLGSLADWHLGLGLSLVGKAAASLLFGSIDASMETNLNAPRHASDSMNQLVPNLELFLGLQWETCLNRDKLFFSVNAGWEANCWWNQCALPVFIEGAKAPLPTTNNQAVTMEGLTIAFHLGF